MDGYLSVIEGRLDKLTARVAALEAELDAAYKVAESHAELLKTLSEAPTKQELADAAAELQEKAGQ